MDQDLLDYSAEQLLDEVMELRTAIRQHRDEKGHDRCWLDDVRLYKALPEGKLADFTLPNKCEWMLNCDRYWDSRQPPPSQEVS